MSHVLQCNTSVSDFSAPSNSFRSNATVWLWLFGHTVSNSTRSFINPPPANFAIASIVEVQLQCAAGHQTECPAAVVIRCSAYEAVLSSLDGSASPGLQALPSSARWPAIRVRPDPFCPGNRGAMRTEHVYDVAPLRPCGLPDVPNPYLGRKRRRSSPVFGIGIAASFSILWVSEIAAVHHTGKLFHSKRFAN